MKSRVMNVLPAILPPRGPQPLKAKKAKAKIRSGLLPTTKPPRQPERKRISRLNGQQRHPLNVYRRLPLPRRQVRLHDQVRKDAAYI